MARIIIDNDDGQRIIDRKIVNRNFMWFFSINHCSLSFDKVEKQTVGGLIIWLEREIELDRDSGSNHIKNAAKQTAINNILPWLKRYNSQLKIRFRD